MIQENVILLHAYNEGADQSVHQHICCIHSLENEITSLAICKTSPFWYVSVAEYTGLNQFWSQIHKTGFHVTNQNYNNKLNLDHDAIKPVFGVSDKARLKPVSSATMYKD